ncbi:MAG: hypothetical protein M1826_006084 [Phylliscum demangeonii]|nr:MAG: hypothetical protein M1826_006084 [Phylliscum demangeonii]
MAERKNLPVFFFDIDNCLYSRRNYFVHHLALSSAEATRLAQDYYRQYGLAIEGLVRHHKLDPLEYNRQVDDALPLEEVLAADPGLRRLLMDVDRSKVRLWLLTNAYVTHAKRVVKLLGVDDLFEGMTYCDYGADRIICKPYEEMFRKAEAEARAPSSEACFFVEDDSFSNCQQAQALGWTAVHLLEPEDPDGPGRASRYQIRSLEELRTLFPQFFVSHSSSSLSSSPDR